MKEDLLQFIWKMKAIPPTGLRTEQGEELEILHFGTHNHNQGPDFLEAHIRLGDVELYGNVELHVKGSDWNNHGHTGDLRYGNVILHVVYEDDVRILDVNGRELPVFLLKPHIKPEFLEQYRALLSSGKFIPCSGKLQEVSEVNWVLWKERLLIERLERKSKDIVQELETVQGDWEEVFYRFLFRYAAMGVNADLFFAVAQTIPLNVLRKLRLNPFSIEALLLGQANLLYDPTDSYSLELEGEYVYQKRKWGLPVVYVQPAFHRMRPANFPSLRLAQLTAVLCGEEHLFRKVLEASSIQDVRSYFKKEVSPYWRDHFTLGKKSPHSFRKMGDNVVRNLLINLVVPFQFTYSSLRDDWEGKNKALKWMEQLKPDKNRIIDGWKRENLTVQSAFDSQALLQLFNDYCSHKKCLNCAIGANMLTNYDSKHS